MRINTPFTQLLNNRFLQVPVVCAPMAIAGCMKLASEVTLGGGFGFVAAGYNSPQHLRHELSNARTALQLSTSEILPIGVGYLAWKLEEPGNPAEEMLDAALDSNVQAIWLAFGNDLGKWVEYVRQYDLQKQTGRRTIIFILVNSVEEAIAATERWKADVLVAQGNEAGGHGGNYAPSTFALLSSILSTLPKDNRPPILAAGGLYNGAQVASLLTLGASGAVFGTRFLLTPESLYTDLQKSALLNATSSSTVRTLAFDHARGTLGWPKGIDGRGLRNEIVKTFEEGGGEGKVNIKVLSEVLKEGNKKNDPDHMVVWAGAGVGEMKEIEGAQAIVRQMSQVIVQRLQDRSLFLDDASTAHVSANL